MQYKTYSTEKKYLFTRRALGQSVGKVSVVVLLWKQTFPLHKWSTADETVFVLWHDKICMKPTAAERMPRHTFQCSFDITYLSTNREQNLPMHPFSTFLGCRTNHLWVPNSFPCKTPNYVKNKSYYVFHANILRHACLTAVGRTWLHLVSEERMPILWASTSSLTSTSTNTVASLHFHSPRPKITSCFGKGRGMWT